jgi:hypothetical protein
MSEPNAPPVNVIDDDTKKTDLGRDVEHGDAPDFDSIAKGDILGQESVDPVLDAKMHLVNNVSSPRFRPARATIASPPLPQRSSNHSAFLPSIPMVGRDPNGDVCFPRPSTKSASRRTTGSCSR